MTTPADKPAPPDAERIGPFLCEWCDSPLASVGGTLKTGEEIRATGLCKRCRALVWSKSIPAPPPVAAAPAEPALDAAQRLYRLGYRCRCAPDLGANVENADVDEMSKVIRASVAPAGRAADAPANDPRVGAIRRHREAASVGRYFYSNADTLYLLALLAAKDREADVLRGRVAAAERLVRTLSDDLTRCRTAENHAAAAMERLRLDLRIEAGADVTEAVRGRVAAADAVCEAAERLFTATRGSGLSQLAAVADRLREWRAGALAAPRGDADTREER